MKELLSVTNYHYREPHEYKSLRKGDMLFILWLLFQQWPYCPCALSLWCTHLASWWASVQLKVSSFCSSDRVPFTSHLRPVLLVSSQFNLTVFCHPWAKYPDVEASILSNIDAIAVSLNKQMSCTLHLCNMLLYSAANWSFHLGGSFLSLMAKGQQIFGYELGGNLTHI